MSDYDFDGSWDYMYDPTLGTFDTYVAAVMPSFSIPWYILAIIGVVVGVILILFILVKTGYIYIYEEYVTEE